jgi:hypothetical protein
MSADEPALSADVLGGRVVTEENPCIVRLTNCCVIMDSNWGPDGR